MTQDNELSLHSRIKEIPRHLRNWIRWRFCPSGQFTLILTNDPDHSQAQNYRRVFDMLNKLNLKVTTAVFCTTEDDGSDLAKHCSRGETHTLEDPEYRELMIEQLKLGHEIAYHGYSQVSNTREKFVEGLEIFRETFGEYPFTYIEHGGHPDTHPPGMVKSETLAKDGMNAKSSYYLLDILQEKLKCVWAWHAHSLFDNDFQVKFPEDVFYEKHGVLFFKRCRMHYIDRMISELPRKNGIFMGYTHFNGGPQGYPPTVDYRFENWTGHHLQRVEKALTILLKRNNIRNMTIRELVEERNARLTGDRK
ncbi:hypothetical protein ACFL1X_05705 [Candidatus Hydrogenedentota bacterium]